MSVIDRMETIEEIRGLSESLQMTGFTVMGKLEDQGDGTLVVLRDGMLAVKAETRGQRSEVG